MVSMSLRRAILRLSGGKELSALCDQALVSGANFATNVILARALGIREYGVFALSWMAVLFVASLQWAFIVSPMMSVGPKQEEAGSALLLRRRCDSGNSLCSFERCRYAYRSTLLCIALSTMEHSGSWVFPSASQLFRICCRISFDAIFSLPAGASLPYMRCH